MVKTNIRSSRGGVIFSAGKGNIPLLPAVGNIKCLWFACTCGLHASTKSTCIN